MKRVVLTVDDSATTRAFVRRAFGAGQPGAPTVLEARNGQEALDVLSREPVDLVITDLHMPQMSGVSLVRRVLAEERTRSIPVIIASSEPDPAVVRSLLQAGARGHLPKPFTVDELRVLVNRIMGAGWSEPDRHESVPSGTGASFAADLPALLRESLTTALETSASVSPEAAVDAEAVPAPAHPLMASIGFEGPASGVMQIIADDSFGTLVAANMQGCAPSESSAKEASSDALQELANITCGVMLKVFPDGHKSVPRMGLPSISAVPPNEWNRVLADRSAAVVNAQGHGVAVRVSDAA